MEQAGKDGKSAVLTWTIKKPIYGLALYVMRYL